MRSVLLVAHTGRQRVRDQAAEAARLLLEAGLEVRMLPDEAADVASDRLTVVAPDHAADGAEVVLVLGGDGTFLRAAEFARPAGVPMLGVNLGHVGFLAEADPQALPATIDALVRCEYEVEERVTVDADVVLDGVVRASAWALNEVSLERTNRERMLEIAVAVDGRPLLRFGCDGVLCSTATGSTAYAFSAGGPILWPNVDALLVVPNAAHALFTRPIVVAPTSVVDIDMLSDDLVAVISCDGRRSVAVPAGARVRVRRGAYSVRIARLGRWSFADRLVSRFQLPARGFRDAGRAIEGTDPIGPAATDRPAASAPDQPPPDQPPPDGSAPR
jgi:NAD+ kinase